MDLRGAVWAVALLGVIWGCESGATTPNPETPAGRWGGVLGTEQGPLGFSGPSLDLRLEMVDGGTVQGTAHLGATEGIPVEGTFTYPVLILRLRDPESGEVRMAGELINSVTFAGTGWMDWDPLDPHVVRFVLSRR